MCFLCLYKARSSNMISRSSHNACRKEIAMVSKCVLILSERDVGGSDNMDSVLVPACVDCERLEGFPSRMDLVDEIVKPPPPRRG